MPIDELLALAKLINPGIRRKDIKKSMVTNREAYIKSLISGWSRHKAESYMHNSADEFLRVVCFSEAIVDRFDEILIWSHYADKHKGTRIGFEFPEGTINPFKIVPVQYQQGRAVFDLSKGLGAGNLEKVFNESVKVKSSAWKYEREHRMLTPPVLCQKKSIEGGTTADFIPFKREWVKHVDLGLRAPENDIQAIKVFLQQEYPHVQLRKTVIHPTDYALEYEIV
jgi:hypothetical protein